MIFVHCAVWDMMSNKIENEFLHSAVILHSRPYGETSLLIDFFTQKEGHIRAIARGAKRQKSPWRGILQPFIPLLIQYRGRRDLVTLIQAEIDGHHFKLKGRFLLSAFYINELLVRLLPLYEPFHKLFSIYEYALRQLQQQEALEPILRRFEFLLLQELGYGIELTKNSEQLPIRKDVYYFLSADFTLMASKEIINSNHHKLFKGSSLLAIAKFDFADSMVLGDAKRLFRLVLEHLLGNKPLYSRELFIRSLS